MLSIFTPTYNRAYILPQLYASLKRQTCKKFEWIIVDDGSKDNTASLVGQWIKEEDNFPIIYYKQRNCGKHVAINKGVQLSSYGWFLVVDSDDYLTDNAIEKVIEWINSGIDERYAAVSGTKCYHDFATIGGTVTFTGPYIDCRNNKRYKYGLVGDKAEVYRTSILKKYPFPVFNNERFLTEDSVWNKIAVDGYMIRWFNEPLVVCEYRDDGLTASGKTGYLTLNNFEGYTYSTSVSLSAYGGVRYYKVLCEYIYNAHRKGLNNNEIAKKINISRLLIYLLSFVVTLLSPLIRYVKR